MKKIVRLTLLRFVFGATSKIVIASNGRSGSTMLWDAVADGFVRHKFGFLGGVSTIRQPALRACKGFLVRLACLPDVRFVVCKTHDTFIDAPSGDHKYIFVYADPLESALSVGNTVAREGTGWFRLHQYHLSAAGEFDKLYFDDVLNYAGQITSWLSSSREDLLCIYYDDLWDRQTEISDFLGFPIVLPTRRTRVSKEYPENVNHYLFNRLRQLKSKLESRVERQPNS